MCNLKFGSWNLLAFRRHTCRGIAVGSGQSGWTHFGQTFGSFHSIFCRCVGKFRNTSNSWSTGIARGISFSMQSLLFLFITIDLWHFMHWHFSIWSRLDLLVRCMLSLAIYIPRVSRLNSIPSFSSALIPIVSGTTRSLRCWPLLTNAEQLRSFYYPD